MTAIVQVSAANLITIIVHLCLVGIFYYLTWKTTETNRNIKVAGQVVFALTYILEVLLVNHYVTMPRVAYNLGLGLSTIVCIVIIEKMPKGTSLRSRYQQNQDVQIQLTQAHLNCDRLEEMNRQMAMTITSLTSMIEGQIWIQQSTNTLEELKAQLAEANRQKLEVMNAICPSAS